MKYKFPMNVPLYMLLIILAIFLAIEQWYFWGTPFSFGELHHETWIVALLFGAVILYFTRKR